MAFKSFRPNKKNITEVYGAGIRLFDVLSSGVICGLGVPYSRFGESWVGEYEYDFSAFDRQMELFLGCAPGGYFAPMFQLDTRPWYLKAYPGKPNSFTHLSQIAGDPEYRQVAAAYLTAMLRHSEEKYGDRIYGYFLLGGTTTEWMSDFDHEEPHPLKEAAYRQRTGDPGAHLPDRAKMDADGDCFLTRDEADVREARRFHCELITDLLCFFGSEAQKVLRHKKLLGLYYGYLFELAGPRLFEAGSLDYETIFYSPDYDMFAAPSSYAYRKQTDPSAFMLTQKTLTELGKIYFHEFDHRTHTVPLMLDEPVEDAFGNRIFREIPGSGDRCRTEEESLNLMYRDFVLCRQTGAALWWFDMFDGWFRSPGMLNAIEKMVGISRELLRHDMASAAGVAVFAGGTSLYGVRKNAPAVSASLQSFRRNLAGMGLPYDLYSFSDWERIDPAQYRVFLFLDAYDLTAETASRIKARLGAPGKAFMWLYAPGFISGNGTDLRGIRAVTGVTVRMQNDPYGAMSYADTVTPPLPAGPYFCVQDGDTIARYESGASACAVKESGGLYDVYCALPDPPSALLREIARRFGCFVFSEDPLVYTYVNKTMLGVYNASGKSAAVNVPEDGLYRDFLTDEVFHACGGRLVLPVRTLRTYLLIRQSP